MAASFTVVGIGASAGGLEALQTLFANMHAHSDMAYVVVVHLSPDHESHLPSLLQRGTGIPVTQVTADEPIVPNHIYVIPPNRNLSTIDTHLRLSPLEEKRSERAPIDNFFRALAKSHDGKSIAIVLSGTGSDGTAGLRRIKEAGGLTVAQDPNEAAYPSMPSSAISTGMVDLILPARAILTQIAGYIATVPRAPVPADGEDMPEDAQETLQKIFIQLRLTFGHDFSNYKRSTLMRRISRRMQLHGVVAMDEYLHILRSVPHELEELLGDILITVTSFFRDPEAFAILKEDVLPRLLENQGNNQGIRVWTVGCATGEEAYSIAMLLLEQSDALGSVPPIQVFASDISETALARAREGLYPTSIANDMTPERLARFFVEEAGGYRVRNALREVVLFASHNLLKDPPFSKLDLVVCRNLLIYLQRSIHHQIYEIFHYALKPDGYLFLGASETPDTMDLFRPAHKKNGIYQRQSGGQEGQRLPALPLGVPMIVPERALSHSMVVEAANYGALHGRMVERYAPPSVLVNREYNIVHLSAQAGRYLQQPGGEPTNNILQRIRPELRIELTVALYGAFEKGLTVHTQAIAVPLDGDKPYISLSVRPATDPALNGFVLVLFEEFATEQTIPLQLGAAGGQMVAVDLNVAPVDYRDATMRELEEELKQTKQRLRTTIEEFETSKEEMRASNEELQSMNEELKSTAEELETSREELQSINEELMAVNQENKNKVEELSLLSSDMRNLLDATDIATLILDRHLRISRFTPRLTDLFNILPTDRGRPLGDLTHRLNYNNLLADAREVLRRLVPIEREIRADGDKWHLMRLLPYRTIEDRIDGVVITFVEISVQKAAEQAQRLARNYAEDLIDSIPDPVLVLNPDLQVQSANQSFYSFFHLVPEQTIGRQLYALGNGEWDLPDLRALLDNVLSADHKFNSYEVNHRFDEIGYKALWLSGQRLNHLQLIVLSIHDVTSRKAAEEALRESEERLRALIDISSWLVWLTDAAGDVVEDSPSWRAYTGQTYAEWRGAGWVNAVHPDERAHVTTTWRNCVETETSLDIQFRLWCAPAQEWRWTHVHAVPLRNENGSVRYWVYMNSDITAYKQIEEALQQRTRQARNLAAQLTVAEQQERQRLSQVLHDDLQQRLYGIQMKLHMAQADAHTGDTDDFHQSLADAETWLSECIMLTRQLSVDLSPPILEDEGLTDALRWLVNQMQVIHGLTVELNADHAFLMTDQGKRLLLYQAVRELLFNVVKYAGVPRATVALTEKDGQIIINVADEGQGFDPAELGTEMQQDGGLGLFSIRERLGLIEGHMTIQSAPGQGTKTTLYAPITQS